ncbi:hypothetical protein GCM10009742_51600 [Kribbella karoonensis]|uniref:Uncharacterized protein n=1 Tax=Kribbella karoonensis TaxID=324851 RepID=A0ABN2E7R3_9ACTN
MGHAVLGAGREQVLQPCGAVEQRVLGMDMQMCERSHPVSTTVSCLGPPSKAAAEGAIKQPFGYLDNQEMYCLVA